MFLWTTFVLVLNVFRQVAGNEHIAVLVYDQHTKEGSKVLQNLETIDDEADLFDIR